MADEQSELGLVAAYNVEIVGVKRTADALAKLDSAIQSLRAQDYSGKTGVTVTAASGQKGGSDDILLSKFNNVVGRVQTKAEKVMLNAMDMGKEIQVYALATATTPTGLSGRGRNGEGRQGPGRDDTGKMIDAVARGVEVLKLPDSTVITGWHGWQADTSEGERDEYFEYQEKGTSGRKQGISKSEARARIRATNPRHGGGIPAANSLGQAIVPVREYLKGQLGSLTK